MTIKKTFKTTLGCSLGLLALAAPIFAQAPDAGLFARKTADAYRTLARYPESSRALAPGDKDPIREKRLPTKQTARGPEGTPSLTVWASAVSVEVGRPVDLFAEPALAGKPALPLEVTGEVANEGGIVAQVTYHDDGKAPDARAGDGVWSARLALPAGLEPESAASYMVRVKARMLDGDVRVAAGGFLYSNPAAHLTGRYRESVVDGNLVISALVSVQEAGRFHLAGTLYTLQGEPIGTAQAAANLEPGRHWIPLSFYGLMFHDRKAAGPYRLGALAFSTTSRMPNALNDLVENAYTTHSYRLAAMTARPFGEVKLLDAAQRLEAEASRLQAKP
jgi:hypothetical protein